MPDHPIVVNAKHLASPTRAPLCFFKDSFAIVRVLGIMQIRNSLFFLKSERLHEGCNARRSTSTR